MRRAPVVVVLLVAALLAAPAPACAADSPAEPAGARASLTDIEDEVMCPICGTPLSLAAAPQAERQRAFIRRLIDQGRTKDEIKQELVNEFGPEVLATPQPEGFDLAAWVVPGAGLLLAAVALGAGVWRWRRRAPAAEADGALDELDTSDGERLRSDLARYDL